MESRPTFIAGASGCRLVESVYPPDLKLPPHAHDFTNVSIVLSGALEEESTCGRITAGPGCVVFKPAGTEHGNRVGSTGAVLFALRLDPRWRDSAARIAAYLWCSHDGIARALLRLYAFAQAAADAPPAQVDQGIRRWLCQFTQRGDPTPMSSSPSWLTALQQSLHLQADQATRIHELARTFDTHPVYVARAFRRYLGSSPTAYSRRVRTAQAAHRLVSTHAPLVTIAAELGFADQAHFCRCFREHIGLSPGEYRRLSRPL